MSRLCVVLCVVVAVLVLVCGLLYLKNVDLSHGLAACRSNVSKLRIMVHVLESNVSRLGRELSSARSRISQLEERVRNLTLTLWERDLKIQSLEDRLFQLSQVLNETLVENGLCTFSTVNMSRCFSDLLERDVDEVYTYLYDNVVLMRMHPSSVEKMLAAFRFLLDVSVYRPDPSLTIALPNGTTVTWSDVWRDIVSTVTIGGDCEDLAVSLAALLDVLHVGRVYVVMFWNSTMGHVFDVAVVDGRVYVLDPANMYVNGYYVLLELHMIKWGTGERYYVFLEPLDIPWSVFDWLYDHDYVRVVMVDKSYDVLCNMATQLSTCARYVMENAPYLYGTGVLHLLVRYLQDNGYYTYLDTYTWTVCSVMTHRCVTFSTLQQVVNYIVG